MLNAPKLSELLAKNVDPKLYPRLFVMSPNGTLMAYSTYADPVDIKEVRDQAALVSLVWKEHAPPATSPQSQAPDDSGYADPPQRQLETLTIEAEHNNIIVRAIQPTLLLVLVGAIPPKRKRDFKITAEAEGDPRYPPAETPDLNGKGSGHGSAELLPPSEGSLSGRLKTASLASTMSQKERDIKLGVLHIQRKKVDALTKYIRAEFEAKGFVMPDEAGIL